MTDSPFPIRDVGSRPELAPKERPAKTGSETEPDVSFQDVLRDSIRNVNKLQTDAESAIQKMATGGTESVAEVMTAVEKADIAFKTLMEVRNKLVGAYEELMRMRF